MTIDDLFDICKEKGIDTTNIINNAHSGSYLSNFLYDDKENDSSNEFDTNSDSDIDSDSDSDAGYCNQNIKKHNNKKITLIKSTAEEYIDSHFGRHGCRRCLCYAITSTESLIDRTFNEGKFRSVWGKFEWHNKEPIMQVIDAAIAYYRQPIKKAFLSSMGTNYLVQTEIINVCQKIVDRLLLYRFFVLEEYNKIVRYIDKNQNILINLIENICECNGGCYGKFMNKIVKHYLANTKKINKLSDINFEEHYKKKKSVIKYYHKMLNEQTK